MTPLSPKREAEIRRDVELECASPTEALLLAALDATRAELAEVRAERESFRYLVGSDAEQGDEAERAQALDPLVRLLRGEG